MTYLVVYVSTATHLLSVRELADLLDESRVNNRRRNLTGALLYQDGNFMQVLEGEKDRVKALYTTIAADGRHHDVTMLWEDADVPRQFETWSMAFCDLTGEQSELSHEFGDYFRTGGAHGQADHDVSVAHYLLDSFRDTLNMRGAI